MVCRTKFSILMIYPHFACHKSTILTSQKVPIKILYQISQVRFLQSPKMGVICKTSGIMEIFFILQHSKCGSGFKTSLYFPPQYQSIFDLIYKRQKISQKVQFEVNNHGNQITTNFHLQFLNTRSRLERTNFLFSKNCLRNIFFILPSKRQKLQYFSSVVSCDFHTHVKRSETETSRTNFSFLIIEEPARRSCCGEQ